MHDWDVVRCSDHHFQWVIYGLAAFIANYPEQTAMSGIVYNWCVTFILFIYYPTPELSAHQTRCDAKPDDLDNPSANPQTWEQMAALLKDEDPETLWFKHGIIPDFLVCHPGVNNLTHSDIGIPQPFMIRFPHANVHELLSCNLLHQAIKVIFKDHLVQWVKDYLKNVYGPARGEAILDEIDRWIALTPLFPGLRRFKQGQNFKQWTGNDSKAFMKVTTHLAPPSLYTNPS